MANPDDSRHIQVKSGDETVAEAEIWAAQESGTAHASLRAEPGHIPPGSRASLVDAVMDLPEVQGSAQLKAAVPLGDSESLERLRERTEDLTSRPAGSTALVHGKIPAAGHRESSAEPGDESAEPGDESTT
jgi:hypothetical protein